MATFQLPHGSEMDDYQIYLFVHIIDDSDGIFEYNVPTTLKIMPNPDLIQQLTAEFINSLSPNSTSDSNSTEPSFIDTLKAQGVATVTTFIMSFTAMINSQALPASNTSFSNSSNAVVFFYNESKISNIYEQSFFFI